LADLTGFDRASVQDMTIADADDVHAVVAGTELRERPDTELAALAERLAQEVLWQRPLYEVLDRLYGTAIGAELDEQVIRAWLGVAGRDVRRTVDELVSHAGSEVDADPETVIALVLRELGVPDAHWVAYFTQELARLHGWAGFIRWRSNTSHYYWEQGFPGDLVDYMAVRTLLALTLLRRRAKGRMPFTFAALSELIGSQPVEAYLRNEFHGAEPLPEMARALEDVLLRRNRRRMNRLFNAYRARKREWEAGRQVARLSALAGSLGLSDQLRRLSPAELRTLLDASSAFRKREGMIWLEAMEAKAMDGLLRGLSLVPDGARDKRPFAKALFCIDTRSERIRRNLESVGDYQTDGVAEFFGVPVSFMELGKGSESHLCPVLL
jgi:uncharacterized protein YbcC (UPF0753/DUF2309 family)